jgi:hypothetical protein
VVAGASRISATIEVISSKALFAVGASPGQSLRFGHHRSLLRADGAPLRVSPIACKALRLKMPSFTHHFSSLQRPSGHTPQETGTAINFSPSRSKAAVQK